MAAVPDLTKGTDMPNTKNPPTDTAGSATGVAASSPSRDTTDVAARAFENALGSLGIAIDSLRSLGSLFSAIEELSRADSPNTPATRRDFLADLAGIGAYCAGDWSNSVDVSREEMEACATAAGMLPRVIA
jgi:hypothetical protein